MKIIYSFNIEFINRYLLHLKNNKYLNSSYKKIIFTIIYIFTFNRYDIIANFRKRYYLNLLSKYKKI